MDDPLGIQWRKCTQTARLPSRQDGIHFVFKSDEFVTIGPNETASISTGIGFHMPHNVGGLVYPYAGFLSLYFPRFIADTGDTPLSIKIWNFGQQPLHIQRGTNISKMLCQEMTYENLTFTKLHDDAIEPVRQIGSPGWILKSPRDFTIEPSKSELFLTGITTPGIQGYNAFVYPYHEFATSNYIISDSNDNLGIFLTNCTREPVHISRGDDLGLIAVNQAIHFEVVEDQGPLIAPPAPAVNTNSRRG
jgi:dUTPase